MLAVDNQQLPPLFRKRSIFRRFARKETPLEISSPVIREINEPQSSQLLQPPQLSRKLQRRSTERQLERVPETPPSLLPLHTNSTKKPTTFIRHIRVDSGISSDLAISRQFSRSQPTSPARSYHSSRPSVDSTSHTTPRANRNEHATSPFPPNTYIGAWDLFLPPSQVHALYTGFLPENLADEWFIYSEGPDLNGKLKVHFHRAWTGLKVAELFVVMDLKGEGAGKIVGIKWNGSEQTSWMGEEEAKRAVRRSCRGALDIRLEGEEF